MSDMTTDEALAVLRHAYASSPMAETPAMDALHARMEASGMLETLPYVMGRPLAVPLVVSARHRCAVR